MTFAQSDTNNVTINDTETDKDQISGFRVTTDAKVYMLLKEDPTQTREELAKKTGKTIRTIQRALEKLSSEGKIRSSPYLCVNSIPA